MEIERYASRMISILLYKRVEFTQYTPQLMIADYPLFKKENKEKTTKNFGKLVPRAMSLTNIKITDKSTTLLIIPTCKL